MKRMLMIALTVAVLPLGCATTTERVLDTGGETQLQKRSYESRIFDTSDKEMVLRAIISTLQDLGFVTDRADFTLGTVSGTKYERYQIKITVSVRPKGKDRMMVRANAQFNIEPINDPKQYQDFFSSLEKSLFLAAHEAD
jgi:hypothetical protein